MQTLADGSVQLNYWLLFLVGAIAGIVCGLLPLILGFVKKKVKLGIIGFVACIIVAIPFSLLAALLVSIVFSIIITESKRLAIISSLIVEFVLAYFIFDLSNMPIVGKIAAAFGVALGFTLLSLLFARLIGKTTQLWIYIFSATFVIFYLTEAALLVYRISRALNVR